MPLLAPVTTAVVMGRILHPAWVSPRTDPGSCVRMRVDTARGQEQDMRTITRLTAFVAALALAVPATSCSVANADTVGTAPVSVLAGASTGLNQPFGLTRGAGGELVVANFSASSVSTFAAGAAGNAAPLRSIAGAITGLSGPVGVAVDASGFLFVASCNNNAIRVFAPGATGNVAPVKSIVGAATGLGCPTGIIVLPDGRLLVANASLNSVVEFAPSATGNAAPTRTLAGAATGLSFPVGFALTPDGDLYVGNSTTITVYHGMQSGNVAPARTIGGLASGLTSVFGVAVDGDRNVYASSSSDNRVVVFAAGANGNASPRRVLTGPTTQLNNPFGILVDAARRVTVANRFGNAVNTYDPLVTPAVVTAPSRVRSLQVAGRARAKRRTISWAAPVSNGGAPLVRYDVVVRKGGKVVKRARVAPTHHTFVLRTKRLKQGRYTARVRAVNATGAGAFAVKGFRIRK